MLNDELRNRLAQIHLSQAPGRLPWPRTATHMPHLPARDECGEIFAQAEECTTPSGTHLRFRKALVAISPAAGPGTSWPAALASAAAQGHAELATLAENFPHRTMFLDLETCGFAGSPVFLAGLVWQRQGALVLDQLFARNYSEERALLESLWQIAADNRVLVTFNGKSFDWPMVHDRSTLHHLGRDLRGRVQRPLGVSLNERGLSRADPRPELAHCDLLHHARRRWKHVLPNCRLQTLERFVCNRARRGDVSGAEVPLAYHEFVRSGNAQPIAQILRHNALDLLTLVELAVKLLTASERADCA